MPRWQSAPDQCLNPGACYSEKIKLPYKKSQPHSSRFGLRVIRRKANKLKYPLRIPPVIKKRTLDEINY